MTIVKVPAETEFLGVVTLRDPTLQSAAILKDALERLTRLGASSREWGRCKTVIEGYKLSDREELASYELGGTTPDGLCPVSDMAATSADEAYQSFAQQCEQLVAQFGDSKKSSPRQPRKAKERAAEQAPEENEA